MTPDELQRLLREKSNAIEEGTSRLAPADRYLRDPHFHALVDLLTHYLMNAQWTPTEIREAVILAAIRVETFTTRPLMFRVDDGVLDPSRQRPR